MFKESVSSCRWSGDSYSCPVEEEPDDEDFLPMVSPKLELGLSRQLTARASLSGSEASDSNSASFPPVSERLKPQLFRRKDPALHFQAAVRGDARDLNNYLLSGGDPDSRDEQGWALLHHATMHGREDCVCLLLRKGARHDMVAIGGHTVLHLASANRHCKVVKRLVEAGALVNSRNAHGNTPLHSAAATGTVDVLKYLLSRSADPDAINSVGETPDEVCGATAEVVDLLDEARRLKKARIAQRFALVKIHKLWNSGRAEPCSGQLFATASHHGAEKRLEEEEEDKETRVQAAPGTGAGGSISPLPASGDQVARGFGLGQLDNCPRHSTWERGSGEGLKDRRPRPTLESTVVHIAGLPQEVFRRLVCYSSL